MVIGIGGSRDFRYMGWVASFVRQLPTNSSIVTGGHVSKATGKVAPTIGVDSAAAAAGKLRGFPIKLIPPQDEDIFKAGYPAACIMRNQIIVDDCEEFYAFWDGKSKGTKNTIIRAIAAKKIRMIQYQHGPVSVYRIVAGKLMNAKFSDLEQVPPLYRAYGGRADRMI